MTISSVKQKLETIQKIFRALQENYSAQITFNDYEPEFRSIAFEAASMRIALEDLSSHNTLSDWNTFSEKNDMHAAQIHVGLGWAFAQKEISPFSYLGQLKSVYCYRVFDGYGFYDGMFRKRKSVINRQKPEWDDDLAFSEYYQGLGRSLWYSNNGEIAAVKNLIEKFPEQDQADLWRGLGIAVAYVGGCYDDLLQIIFLQSGKFKNQLKLGAVLALVSRNNAGFISADTRQVCEKWTGRTTDEILQLNEIALHSDVSDNISKYHLWRNKISIFFH